MRTVDLVTAENLAAAKDANPLSLSLSLPLVMGETAEQVPFWVRVLRSISALCISKYTNANQKGAKI